MEMRDAHSGESTRVTFTLRGSEVGPECAVDEAMTTEFEPFSETTMTLSEAQTLRRARRTMCTSRSISAAPARPLTPTARAWLHPGPGAGRRPRSDAEKVSARRARLTAAARPWPLARDALLRAVSLPLATHTLPPRAPGDERGRARRDRPFVQRAPPSRGSAASRSGTGSARSRARCGCRRAVRAQPGLARFVPARRRWAMIGSCRRPPADELAAAAIVASDALLAFAALVLALAPAMGACARARCSRASARASARRRAPRTSPGSRRARARRAMTGFYEFLVAFGVLCAFVAYSAVRDVEGGWRLLFALVAPFALAQLALIGGMPEPRWLVARGRSREARDMLANIAGCELEAGAPRRRRGARRRRGRGGRRARARSSPRSLARLGWSSRRRRRRRRPPPQQRASARALSRRRRRRRCLRQRRRPPPLRARAERVERRGRRGRNEDSSRSRNSRARRGGCRSGGGGARRARVRDGRHRHCRHAARRRGRRLPVGAARKSSCRHRPGRGPGVADAPRHVGRRRLLLAGTALMLGASIALALAFGSAQAAARSSRQPPSLASCSAAASTRPRTSSRSPVLAALWRCSPRRSARARSAPT